jgi:uncharacterized membrane protein YfcA
MTAPQSEDESGDGGTGGATGELPGPIPLRPEITQAPVTATVIGLAAGAFSSLLGVGGGLLIVPALVYLLRVRPHRAHGTSLAVVLPTALAGMYRYAQAGNVEAGLVLPLAVGGVLGALIGAAAANALGAGLLKRLLGVLVVVTGCVMIVVPDSYGRHSVLMGAGAGVLAVGLVAGIVSGLLGVGGGIVMVPALVFLLGRDQHVAQGVSLAVIIPVSISGALIHARKGNVIATLAFWLSVGAVIGATVVGTAVQRCSSESLRTLFGVFLLIMGVTMVARPLRTEASRGSSR